MCATIRCDVFAVRIMFKRNSWWKDPESLFAKGLRTRPCRIDQLIYEIVRDDVEGADCTHLIRITTKLTERRHCGIHLQTPHPSLRVQRMVRWCFGSSEKQPLSLTVHQSYRVSCHAPNFISVRHNLFACFALLDRPRISRGVNGNCEKHKRREPRICSLLKAWLRLKPGNNWRQQIALAIASDDGKPKALQPNSIMSSA